MQKKLLYCGALCALFSASNTVFGMNADTNNADTNNADTNNAFIFSTKKNPEKFWGLAIFQSNDIQKAKLTKINSLDSIINSIREFAPSICSLTIKAAGDNAELSVINDKETINLGIFHKSQVEGFLEKKDSLEKNKIGLSLVINNKKHSIEDIYFYDKNNTVTSSIKLEATDTNVATNPIQLTDLIIKFNKEDELNDIDKQNNATPDAITVPDADARTDINDQNNQAPDAIKLDEKKESDNKAPDTDKLDKTEKPTIPTIKSTKSRWILGSLGILAILSSLYYFLKIRTA